MHNYSVINKGEYKHRQTSEALHISRFLIVRRKSKRMLLLEFENLKQDNVTAINLSIDQYDARGNYLGVATLSVKDLNFKKGKFILKENVVLHRACVDFFVKVLWVEYGEFKYRLGKNETFVVYEKKQVKEKVAKKTVEKEVGKEGRVNSSRKFSSPVFVSLFAIIIVASVFVATFMHLNKFKNETTSFYQSNIEYEFANGKDVEGGDLFVKGYVGLGGNGEIVIPAEIDGRKITKINANAFMSNKNIKSLKIEGDISIEDNAFNNCTQLQKVEINGHSNLGLGAFSGCSELQTVTFASVENLGKEAFSDCNKLVDITFNGSVKTIGEKVFAKCKSLKTLSIPDEVESIGLDILAGCKNIEELKIPYFGETIDDSKAIGYLFGIADYGQQKDLIPTSLKKITLSQQKVLVEGTFYGCRKVKEINLSPDLEKIAKNTFALCYRLNYLTIPSTVTEIATDAFSCNYRLFEIENNSPKVQIIKGEGAATFALAVYTPENNVHLEKVEISDCTFLKADSGYVLVDAKEEIGKLSLPTSVNEQQYNVPSYFFFDFYEDEVVLSSGVNSIGDLAFYQTNIKTISSAGGEYVLGLGVFTENLSLTTINLSEATLSNLPVATFANNPLLSTVELPSNLQVITESLFQNCVSLNSVKFPTTLSEIQKSAFSNCVSFEEVDLSNCNELTKIGEMAFYSSSLAKGIALPSSLTEIGNKAFGLSKLIDIVIPDSVQVIKSVIFEGCSSLTSMSIPYLGQSQSQISNLYYFFSLSNSSSSVPSSLKKVTVTNSTALPSSSFKNLAYLTEVDYTQVVTNVGNSAFEACSSLTKVPFTSNVEIFGEGCFRNCSKLASVKFSSVKEIKSHAFVGTALRQIVFSNQLERIGVRAFMDCQKVESITTPFIGSTSSEIKTIGYLFGAENTEQQTSMVPATLKKVVVTSSVTVPDKAFYKCSKLTEVQYQNAVTTIGDSAFANCSALVKVDFTSNVEVFGDYAFSYCYNLKSIDISSAVTMGSNIFESTGLEQVNLPDTLLSVPEYAFYYCNNLQSVNLNEVQTIKEHAFFGCSKLKQIVIPSTTLIIGNYAFSSCSGLEKVTLSENLSKSVSIGSSAFWGCYNLYEIRNLAKLDLTMGSRTKGEIAFYAIYLPQTSYAPELKTKTENNVTYKYNSEVCAIVDYSGNTTKYNFEKITLDGKEYSSYIIAYDAFGDRYSLRDITFKNVAVDIRSYAFYRYTDYNFISFEGCEMKLANNLFGDVNYLIFDDKLQGISSSTFSYVQRVLYKGTKQEWDTKINKSEFAEQPDYYYQECFHESNSQRWNYNQDGSINFTSQPYKSETTKQPTCTTAGIKRIYCDTCGHNENQMISELGHSYNQYHYCIRCKDVQPFEVNKTSNYQGIVEFTNDEAQPFDVFNTSSTKIASTNTEKTSQSTFEITAKIACDIEFTVAISQINYGIIIVYVNGQAKTIIDSTAGQKLNFSLNEGDKIKIEFTRSDSEFEQPYCCYLNDIKIS